MKRMKTRLLPVLALLLGPLAAIRAAETFDEAMKRATAEYGERLRKAADELNGARKRIADEKAPFLLEMRAAEDRIVTAQSEIELIRLDEIRKNATYVSTLAHDSLKTFEDGLAPGEGQLLSDRLHGIEQALDDTSAGTNGRAAADVADFLLERVRQSLGGYTAAGSSLVAGSNRVFKGSEYARGGTGTPWDRQRSRNEQKRHAFFEGVAGKSPSS